MNYIDVINILVPCMALIYIFENSALKSMIDKEKLEKFKTINQIDTALCLTVASFIVCDIFQFICETETHIWIYSIIGMIIGIVVGTSIIISLSKYFKKKVNENE